MAHGSSYSLPSPNSIISHSCTNKFDMNSLFRRINNGRRSSTDTDNTDSLGSTYSASEALSPDGVDLSSSAYAIKRRRLMALANRLRDLGASHLIELPSIVVIGGQSAGKSSLVEAVSGINVPRDSGTCTRCPMECNMSNSGSDWSCTISLRMEYDSRGRPLSTGTSVVAFGPRIVDRNQFEIFLRRAQAAILNPHISQESFLTKSAREIKEMAQTDPKTLKFSKNIVCVNITDPEATEIAFVDLPGLIQNDVPEIVQLVHSLVVSYISHPQMIILVAIPMSDDMENQQAKRLSLEADPQGLRTIGILTKPDMLTEGAISARQKWRDVLEGRLETLKHGYYCVMLPDDAQRSQNLSRHALQQAAADFFLSTSPWCDLPDQNRLGIPGFVADVSKLLVEHLENSLPQMRNDICRLLDGCERKLGQLPKPITCDPHVEVVERISNFCKDLQGAADGRSQDKTLVQMNRGRYTRYNEEIEATEPFFVPYPAGPKNTPRGARNLTDVRAVIDSSIAWELPHNVPFEAKEKLILEFLHLWHGPSRSCFHDAFSNLVRFTNGLITKHFGRFKQLDQHIRAAVRDQLEATKVQGIQALETTLAVEKLPLYAADIEGFNMARLKWLAYYKDNFHHNIRRESTESLAMNDNIDTINEEIDTISEKFEDELILIAEVRAYFDLAHRRIIHSVPMTIEHSLNQPLATAAIHETLLRSVFALGDSDKMSALLGEEPEVEAVREALESRKRQLLDIQTELDAFSLI